MHRRSPGICAGTGNARTHLLRVAWPRGATATIQIVATMVAVTPGQQILNSATVVAGVLDPVPANNIGTATVSVPTLEPSGDADGDGLSNGFETTYGLDPFGAAGSGAADDPDGDGRTNLQELAGGHTPAWVRDHVPGRGRDRLLLRHAAGDRQSRRDAGPGADAVPARPMARPSAITVWCRR